MDAQSKEVRKVNQVVHCGNGTGESYSVNDGPQRKMTEENEVLRCAQGIFRSLLSTNIHSRFEE